MMYVTNYLIITILLSIGYSQCNESNWQEYYPNMENCNLYEADLAYTNLSDSNLSYANLGGANLTGANLSWTNLYGTNLEEANLSCANLNGANLFYTNVNNSIWDECSITDENNDGYDDVSYETGYIAGHSDGVVFGMESVDITIDNQASYDEGYTTGEASVDTNNDGLVDEFPVISIIGDEVAILTQTDDDEYTDAGANCQDTQDGFLSHAVEVSGQVVNLHITGTYTVNYDCTDSDGNQAITESRTVVVVSDYTDENNDGLVDDFPLITILGGSVLTFTQNHDDNYIDPGATCYSGGMNNSQDVEISGDVVNLSTINTYIITYNCSDNEGNQAMPKSRTVIVLADYSDEDNDGYDDVSYDAGAESGDLNLDGIDNVLDVVILVENILNP